MILLPSHLCLKLGWGVGGSSILFDLCHDKLLMVFKPKCTSWYPIFKSCVVELKQEPTTVFRRFMVTYMLLSTLTVGASSCIVVIKSFDDPTLWYIWNCYFIFIIHSCSVLVISWSSHISFLQIIIWHRRINVCWFLMLMWYNFCMGNSQLLKL